MSFQLPKSRAQFGIHPRKVSPLVVERLESLKQPMPVGLKLGHPLVLDSEFGKPGRVRELEHTQGAARSNLERVQAEHAAVSADLKRLESERAAAADMIHRLEGEREAIRSRSAETNTSAHP